MVPEEVLQGRELKWLVRVLPSTPGEVLLCSMAGGVVSESASIGIENAIGGNNNYLNALTGSGQTSHSLLTSSKWPKYNFRFTPGAPTALAGGIYNVGVGQTYPNLSEAVADVNHRGITGPITLNLTDANYDYTTSNGGNLFPIRKRRFANRLS